MMKREVVAFLVLFALTAQCCLAASGGTAPATSSPPSPAAGFSWPKLQKCIKSYHSAAGTCWREVCTSFVTHKVSIGQDCCAAIVQSDDDCASYMFAPFNNAFFPMLLKAHCSGSSSPAPATPAPATPAPSPPKATPAPPKA